MSMHLWIQSLILQQIWAKQTVFYLIHRDSKYTIKTGEVKQRQEVMSDSEGPMEESKTLNNFIKKYIFKISKSGNMIGWHLKPRSFRFSTAQDIMIDTFKFTSKSKVW